MLKNTTDKEIEVCLESVEKAVTGLKSEAHVYFRPNDFTLEELRRRGFNVVRIDDQREGPITTIGW